jgi:signal transduction histidine kinase
LLHYSIYLRLIVLTAGTLLPFFWIVVILGHRRQRNFERVFFFLCLALVFFFGGSLLALNGQLYYSTIPPSLAIFCWVVVCLGLWFLPSLLVHLQVEYAQVRELILPGIRKRIWLAGAYLPTILLLPRLLEALRLRAGFNFVTPSSLLGAAFPVWLIASLSICAVWQRRFAKAAPDARQKTFHRSVQYSLGLLALATASIHAFMERFGGVGAGGSRLTLYVSFAALIAMLPMVALVRNVQKFNFLQIGRQRNLIYAVFATFVALLYLSLVRRASLWMEPYLPPEATAAILLFLPVVFFEPLQRLMRGVLLRAAHSEMDRVQRLMAEIQQEARQGDLRGLVKFIERRVREQFELAEATLTLVDPTKAVLRPHVYGPGERLERMSASVAEQYFRVQQKHGLVAILRAEPHGAGISGETRAALEFLCEQLPGALDLCRLIEEKLQLERELAERERLAVLGQMAASISHNLKNPLGSIKTILQVQLESDELPESIRGETKMVLEEIGRLSSKLNQLLQFSRPAIRGGVVAAVCDARAVAEEVSGVLRHEAERRGIALEVEVAAGGTKLAASSEAVSEILSNLVVNALEATARGGSVKVSGNANGDGFLFAVEDDGPGVPESAREKILQPFFTTKTQGTGLGLAIVARRVAEFGGKLDWESPVRDGRGTRFAVNMPMKSG